VESCCYRWPVEILCRVMRVSPRGYRSWRSRPISRDARTDMAVLAHIREQYNLSLGSYGRPRMTMELKEAGLDVGWAVSDRMKKDLAIRALDMAVRLRRPPEGCLFHSDRGSQYCSYDYQKKLQAYGLRPSMSGKGNCYDNASVETFFKSLKAEMIWRQKWHTRRLADAAIFQYIGGFYNTRRRHSYLSGIRPLAFEAKVA
jgi:hypothetical protein